MILIIVMADSHIVKKKIVSDYLSRGFGENSEHPQTSDQGSEAGLLFEKHEVCILLQNDGYPNFSTTALCYMFFRKLPQRAVLQSSPEHSIKDSV